MQIELIEGDITTQQVDAIVNAANSSLLGGGGVDGVIHTVGPVHSSTEDRTELLRSCYTKSLRVADELGARSVAFPLISAGVYRWPVEDAVRQALTTLRGAAPVHVRTARLVLFGPEAAGTAQRVAAELG
ncbi:macro domain-containing protein [Actinoplanes siamensis]|uniref:Macro domain-containing protein n=1 Tax=Actinoplanes siamensis TaxID=1223317 RepID=A0A919TL64_9ACTN|nr:macro domain-containing protein [Actinoplanes siamensis]GIF06039.1 macro domain-containing protein [Actinoplanes siamensis]